MNNKSKILILISCIIMIIIVILNILYLEDIKDNEWLFPVTTLGSLSLFLGTLLGIWFIEDNY